MARILTAAMALMLSGSAALAADLYTPEPVVEAPQDVVAVSSTGWYLRGDLSYDYNKLKGAEYFQGSNGLMNSFDTASLRSSYNIGAGVGLQATEMLRFDATLDYMFNASFRGSTSGTCGAGGSCKSTDKSSMSAYSLMANAYVDLGHYGMFTPYVGAGLGGTHVNWNKLKNTACNGNDCDGTVTHSGRQSWRFTYALMAGTSIDVSCNVKADAGYRYRHVSPGDMFGYKLNGGPGYDKGLDIHEARLGMRYTFGGCEQATYMPPADIPPVYK